jgi:hypothetical protein
MRWLVVALLLTSCADSPERVAEPIPVPSFSETPDARRFETVTDAVDALSDRGVSCTNLRGNEKSTTFGECDTPLGNISFFIEESKGEWDHVLGRAHALEGPNWVITCNGPDPVATARMVQGALGGRYVPIDT